MPNSPVSVWQVWLRRLSGVALALVFVVLGWSHGVLYVEGGSMRPALYPGDMIVYSRLRCTPQDDELVVFRHDGDLVVHRVVRVLPGGRLRMRGDSNQVADSTPVAPNDVRGTVLAVIPAGRIAARLVDVPE